HGRPPRQALKSSATTLALPRRVTAAASPGQHLSAFMLEVCKTSGVCSSRHTSFAEIPMRNLISLCATLSILATLFLCAAEEKPQFTEHLLQDKYGYAYGIAAADIDGDGDIDLTSVDTVNNLMYWFENDGNGKFKRHIIARDEAGWLERHAIADIDGDGKPD